MFSNELPKIIESVKDIDRVPRINKTKIQDLLEKCINREDLSLEEITELISSTADRENQELIKQFSSNYKRPFNKRVLLLPPLYIDSICANRCKYCNFSQNSGAQLSYEEFKEEFEKLLEIGYRSIEIVSSHDPALFVAKGSSDLNDQKYDIENLIGYFEIATELLGNNGSGMLTTNIPPLDEDSLKRLKDSGLDCFLVWAETFDSGQYNKLHVGKTPKTDQAFRLDSYERAIRAGIQHVAGAFLKGLYDWRKEEIVLYCLDKYLKKEFGRGFSIIGTPRIKGPFQNSDLIKQYAISDEEYEANIALDRILFDGILWLQTRESFSLNKRLIFKYGGGVILTIDSCTAPGGYKKEPKGKEQFPVHKSERKKSLLELESGGFETVFDWNSKTLSDLIRSK